MAARRQSIRVAVAVVLLLAGRETTASAQAAARWDAFGGYALVRDASEDLNFPTGWAAGFAHAVNGWFWLAAEGSGSYYSEPVTGGKISVRAHTLVAGGRASVRVGPVVEFFQVLAGVLYSRGSAFGSTSAEAHLAVQPGAGVDVPLRGRVAARFEFDGRIMPTGHQYRLLTGLVVR